MNKEEFMKYGDAGRFESVSEFWWCIHDGGEVGFAWKGKAYSVIQPDHFYIGEAHYIKDGNYYNLLSHEPYDISCALCCDTPDEVLEYRVGGDRLRDIITQVRVFDRTL